jgi:hypothetical protein
MSLSHPGMARQPLGTQYLAAQKAVADIGFRAVTLDAGRVAAQDTDVMQHGSLREKRRVKLQLGIASCHLQRAVSHRLAVDQQDVLQGRIVGIVSMYEYLGFHDCKYTKKWAKGKEKGNLFPL